MWSYNYSLPNELYHHGVKGQKWGVRRTPEQLGHTKKRLANQEKTDTMVTDAIQSGNVSTQINAQKQSRHTKTGHSEGRSYLNGDLDYAQELVDNLSGTGQPVVDKNGKWTHRERVTSGEAIGTHVDGHGVETETNSAMIVYSKTGSHIYPRKEQKS